MYDCSLITTLIFKGSHADEIYLLKLYTAAGAILGHNYPFYLKFKEEKESQQQPD